ncbi:MAG: ParA family protein [Nanoarchaeota archaeon]|nr:ParA family protein [Nanoarchaeota archaeon]MBU1031251.1 ParA family protein [Nanoarchaeota archaeon]MBU1849592.1 ParA family protein [Nanoarchaeota archaeon]
MRKICVINQKGGVGKTTTSLNLAAGLSRFDRKVLLIDLDPQSNMELAMNLENSLTVYEFLFEDVLVSECVNKMGKDFDLVKGDKKLLRANNLEGAVEKIVSRLRTIKGYDYVIFDCAPSMNILNNAVMLFCKEAIISTSTDYFGLESLNKTIIFLREFADFHEHDIMLSKIVPTLFDKRNKICNDILESINNEYYRYVSAPIRMNSKLKEAPMNKKSIFSYAPKSSGAQDYLALVQAVIADEPNKDADLCEVSPVIVSEEEK